MKNVLRTQRGGVAGVRALETEKPVCNSLEWIPAPPVVLSQEQHKERELRLRANQQPWKREFYPAPACILAIEEE